MDQRERKEIFKDVDGVYDAELIKAAILKYYDMAQEFDGARVLRSKFTKKNQGRHRVNVVSHCREKGIIGTDLIQEMVDFVEDTDGLALNQPVFDPANPVYLLETQKQNGLPLVEEGTEYQHVDPAQVMWTSTTY